MLAVQPIASVDTPSSPGGICALVLPASRHGESPPYGHKMKTIYTIHKTTRTVRAAFTLVELLVVTCVISILSCLVFSGMQNARLAGAKTREISAARTLITAYLSAANDNDGRFLAGYDHAAGELQMPDGSVISGPAAERYPYRLAPYLDYQLTGSILVNDNAKQIDTTSTYLVSCFPVMGINYLFAGGDVTVGSNGAATYTFPGEAVTTIASGSAPILVFASAAGEAQGPDGTSGSGKTVKGYCKLEPPSTTAPLWSGSGWNKKSNPADYGHVDARYNGRAICALLDGSVQVLSIDELRDMRLWSRNASDQSNALYTVPRENTGRQR